MTSIENHPEKNIIRVQLRQNHVLKGMSATSHEELEQHLTLVDCNKGDFLLHQGVHEMEQYFIPMACSSAWWPIRRARR
jgi:hypothetical protein